MWQSTSSRPRCCCRLLVALVTCFVLAAEAREVRDFIAINSLPDGERETRIYYGGVCAKEISGGEGSNSGIKFRQITNNKQLVQLIYSDGDELRDCEIVHQRDQVRKFLNNFKSDLSYLISTSNLTLEDLDNKKLSGDVATWFNFTQLRSSCRKLHQEMKQSLMEYKKNHRWRQKRSMFIVPGTLWCGKSHEARTYTELGFMSKTDRCCRRHDHCKMDIPAFTTKYNYYNYRPYTLSHCHCDSRDKREIWDLLRIPGTKWCGKGFSADKYTRLGGFSRTDKCCRRHDLSCPFWIGALETKYGLFNWRVNTIMHCNCDERFRACLKMVDTSDANLVGKLFFNIVQSQCFVIKPRKRCVKWTWWGTCEKYKHEKQAVLRDNLPY